MKKILLLSLLSGLLLYGCNSDSDSDSSGLKISGLENDDSSGDSSGDLIPPTPPTPIDTDNRTPITKTLIKNIDTFKETIGKKYEPKKRSIIYKRRMGKSIFS